MRLFLSSMHPSNREDLLELIGKHDDMSVAIIPTAWDTYSPERKTAEVQAQITAFEKWGFSTAVLELTTADTSSLQKDLAGKDLVWVMGGNTFYLNYFMHKSGFSSVIADFLNNGLVYGGESAGAVVASSTLKGIECIDDPKDAPEIIWEGLGLIDKGIIPHWGWEKYATELQAAKDKMATTATVITLDNDHALVVDGNRRRIVDNPAII